MNVNLDILSDQVLVELRSVASDAWASWSDAEKELVKMCIKDGSNLLLRRVAGDGGDRAEQAQINAQLANIRAAAIGTASKIMWDSIASVFLKTIQTLKVI